MTIHLDTSVLIDALCAPFRSARDLEAATMAGHLTAISTLVLFEWLRGPRRTDELHAQERFLPAAEAVPFDAESARIAAHLYRGVRRARSRGTDLAIAACVIERGAVLWTLNTADFEDVPALTLYRPRP